MSSAIPTRRTTRVTRATAVKENQNANARTSRMTTRSKPISLVSGTTSGITSGIARPTLASKAKVTATENKTEFHAGKRKREALGEVAVADNKLAGAPSKGKEKEVLDGVILKPRGLGAIRQPLRTVVSRQTTKTTSITEAIAEATAKRLEKKNATQKDQAMVIDPPLKVPLPSIITRRPNFSTKIPAGPGNNRVVLQPSRIKTEEEYEEPVQKKRRTSSPPAEDPRTVEEARAIAEEKAHNDRLAAEMQAFANEVEYDPDNSPWEDLDAEDSDDPLMVSEYVLEIFIYMKKLELTTMPNPNYMESQKELAWKMRGILNDWLIQVHVRFRLLPETLFLCVNIIDRFLSARIVSLAKLQLVGITCMFIAAKFEEIVAPSVSHFLTCADSSYTEGEILQAERYVLKTLDWNLSYPNPVHFLRRVSKADDYNVKVRTLAKYLLEIAILEWRLIAAPPSLLAAASIWLARLALGMEDWSPNLAHYSSYRESSLIPTANLMLSYILKPIKHESFYKKYGGKRYFKSSVFMREWALDRWSENAHVDLSKELCRLKAEIKLEREEEEAAQLVREDSKDLAADYAALQHLRARASAAMN